MNTRQKLTLGIAAIFMVTLTIVGVTYAYFFTRVENVGDDTTDVTASTATISSINYWEQSATPIELGPNALPGDTAENKLFGAANPNEAAGTFRIALTNTPGAVEFLHSSTEKAITSFNEACYIAGVDTDTTDDSACRIATTYQGEGEDRVPVNASYYDNIVFTLYEADDNGDLIYVDGNGDVVANPEDGTPKLAEDDNKNTFENVKVKYLATVNSEQFLTDASGNVATFTVAAGQTKKFVLKVSYLNKTETGKNNQNLEFDADLTIRVTIK